MKLDNIIDNLKRDVKQKQKQQDDNNRCKVLIAKYLTDIIEAIIKNISVKDFKKLSEIELEQLRKELNELKNKLGEKSICNSNRREAIAYENSFRLLEKVLKNSEERL